MGSRLIRQIFSVIAWGLLAFGAVTAQASAVDQTGGTNGDVLVPPSSIEDLPGGLSVDSALRQINAEIEDWKDELTKSKPVADDKCGKIDFWHSIFPGTYPSISYPAVVDSKTLMQEGFSKIQLQPAEAYELGLIQAHAPSTPLDQIEIEISRRELAMEVSNRTYATAIESLRTQSSTAALCEEMTLRVQRDTMMISAAQELIGGYQAYDAAVANVIDGTVPVNPTLP